MGNRLSPPPLPREHGAWAMLVLPLVLGTAAAGRPRLAALLVPPAVTLLFLARYAGLQAATRWVRGKSMPSGYAARRLVWTSVYLAAGVLLLAGAVALAPPAARGAALRAALITGALGSIHAGTALVGWDRTVAAELVGLAGLSSSAPLILTASGRPLDGFSVAIAGLCFAYFVTSVSWVRTYRVRPEARASAVIACVAVHAGVVAAVAVLAWAGWLPGGALLALAPPLARTAWGLSRPPANLRALGWMEMAVALGFVVVAVAAYRVG